MVALVVPAAEVRPPADPRPEARLLARSLARLLDASDEARRAFVDRHLPRRDREPVSTGSLTRSVTRTAAAADLWRFVSEHRPDFTAVAGRACPAGLVVDAIVEGLLDPKIAVEMIPEPVLMRHLTWTELRTVMADLPADASEEQVVSTISASIGAESILPRLKPVLVWSSVAMPLVIMPRAIPPRRPLRSNADDVTSRMARNGLSLGRR